MKIRIQILLFSCQNVPKSILVISAFFIIILGCKSQKNYPDPVSNPTSELMLQGDWFKNPHDINFSDLPKIPLQHVVVSDVRGDTTKVDYHPKKSGGVNQHNYLIFYDNKFWLMWSDGPGVEDRVGQVVKYTTSPDGLEWAEPKMLTPYPPNSDPSSKFYNTRSDEGMRWISRGFWVRNGELLALASLDEANEFFGPSLQLKAFRWNKGKNSWEDIGLVHDNTINNFPPKKLASGEWMTSRRPFNYVSEGVDFLIGGVKDISQWETFPVLGSSSELAAEEPYWWLLPDGEGLMALFRDNRKSGFLYRSFSTDNGRTWSTPIKTNFPDAASKFHGIQLSDGRYVLVSNPDPKKRDPLALSISKDGMVFTKMGYLVGNRPPYQLDYPHVMEHDGYLFVAFSGSTKQKIEVLKIKISDLDKLDMTEYKPKQ